MRKELTKINSRLHNGNYKESGQNPIDDLKLPNTFQSSLNLPSHILSPNSTSPTLPSPSPSPSTSILSPLNANTPNLNTMKNNINNNNNTGSNNSNNNLSASYSSAIPKFDFFENEKVGEKRKFDQFSSNNLDASSQFLDLQSPLTGDEVIDTNCLIVQSNEMLRCNQNGNSLYFFHVN